MTIDPLVCRETDYHVQPQKKFYPTKIPIQHNQLRHFISVIPHSSLIYFASLKDVFCLDTATSKQIHITELPFEPRCTATGYGWFCAGGDQNGYFAALHLPNLPTSGFRGTDNGHSDGVHDTVLDPPRQPSRIRIERLGDDIVNSISIHQLNGEDGESSGNVVAVLTNNDLSVRIYSLTHDSELRVEAFPFPMNHATISPDGRMLVIVGDKEYAYFYQDVRLSSPQRDKTENEGRRCSRPEYESLRVFRLHKPPGESNSGYFTTAWSPSGKLCAVASENGYITVFDVDAIAEAESASDAIVAIVPSSRPNTTPGAIRTMTFLPEPWDLLVWTENHGRACVGDIRSGLTSRQVINLDPTDEGVTKIDVSDASNVLEEPQREHDFDFIRRHQSAITQPEVDALSFADDYLALSAERRRLQRQAGVPELSDDINGLTRQEREILDGLRTTRQREEFLQHNPRVQQGQTGQDRRRTMRDTSHSTSSRPGPQASGQTSLVTNRAQQELARRHRDSAVLGSIRDYMREQSSDNTAVRRERSTPQQPRRRNSIVLSPTTLPNTARPTTGSGSRAYSAVAGRQSFSPGLATDSLDPWRTIVSAMDSSTTSSPDPLAQHNSNELGPARASTLMPSEAYYSSTIRSRLGLPNLSDGQDPIDVERRMRQWSADADAVIAQQQERDREADAIAARSLETIGARQREREWRREVFGNYEASLMRRVGIVGTTGHGTVSGADEEDAEWGVGTTGCAWGDGGRTVYIGTEDGIFELKMNFHERKFWPAVECR